MIVGYLLFGLFIGVPCALFLYFMSGLFGKREVDQATHDDNPYLFEEGTYDSHDQ